MNDINEKILLEKRRRSQAYNAIKYIISATTFFDFFSQEVIQILVFSIILAKLTNSDIVKIEHLSASFFLNENSNISLIFKEKQQNIDFNISIKNKLIEIQNLLKNNNNTLNDFIKNMDINIFNEYYKQEIFPIIDKCLYNAQFRFKTPIITSEILFLTLLETTPFFKNLKNLDYYIIRYKIIKNIYKQESVIKLNTKKNYHYFAYLLKSQISNNNFENFSNLEDIDPLFIFFRNCIINYILKNNIINLIKKDINTLIKTSNCRFYKTV